MTLPTRNIPAVLRCGQAAAEPSGVPRGDLLGWGHTGAGTWGPRGHGGKQGRGQRNTVNWRRSPAWWGACWVKELL